MRYQNLEKISELVDFETGEKIVENHHMIIQNPKNELFVKINTHTYYNRIREILRERYSSGLGDFERKGEDKTYILYLANKNGRSNIGTISRDMLKKGFPEIFKKFNESKFLN